MKREFGNIIVVREKMKYGGYVGRPTDHILQLVLGAMIEGEGWKECELMI